MQSKLYTPILFPDVSRMAKSLAERIKDRQAEIIEILLDYESFEVANDEIDRTIDLLENLKENESYFRLRVGPITTFLPRNQPLYALCCFVVVPALMSTEVHFRIPHAMGVFFKNILDILEISDRFPNIIISKKERLEFLKDRSAILVNPKNGDTHPVTDAVIFTGKSSHAEQLKTVFDKRTLFISNGSGHNPVVVSRDADIQKAVEAVEAVQFYNQGQDCAAPNSILVHKDVFDMFAQKLKQEIANLKVGEYKNRECRIGPISDVFDLVRVQGLLVDNQKWLDPDFPGIIDTQKVLVYPTIINKPLIDGGNFSEVFAPIIFLQKYESDTELKNYFEHKLYAENSMYITLFGTSNYLEEFLKKTLVDQKKIESIFIKNTHLHSQGVERGVNPYGGFGVGASSISINGKTVGKPTLPQKEIFEFVAQPILDGVKEKINSEEFSEIQYKKVYKILRLHNNKVWQKNDLPKVQSNFYLDLNLMKKDLGDVRYLKLDDEYMFSLLKSPNVEYISSLKKDEIELIHKLNALLKDKDKFTQDDFKQELYNLPKVAGEDKGQIKNRQSKFFGLVYELLFAEKYGPQLSLFLKDVNNEVILGLLDV